MDNYNYIKDFKQSMIWQKANLLEQEIAIIVKRFPLIESLKDDIIKSSRCIGANIAEGQSQTYIRKEITHINTALSQVGKVQNNLITAHQNKYITEEELNTLDNKLIELKKMMFGYMKRLKADCNKFSSEES